MYFLNKFLLILFFLFSPILAHAAVTDCQQISSDGKATCLQPYVYWGGGSVKTATFEQYVDITIPSVCSGYPSALDCGNKPTASLPGPYPCSSGANCSLYTHIGTPGTEYNAQIVYYVLNGTPEYAIYWYWVSEFSICPYNTTKIQTGTDSYGIAQYLCQLPFNSSTPIIPIKNTGCPTCDLNKYAVSIGHPVNLGGGNHYQIETDLRNSSTSPISFTRYYNSQLQKWTNNLQMSLFETQTSLGDVITLFRENGNQFIFLKDSNGNWQPKTNDIVGQLTSTSTGWSFQNSNNDIENYNNIGQLISIQKIGGQILNFIYDTSGNLHQVQDSYGNALTITMNGSVTGCLGVPTITNLSFMANDSTLSSNYSYSYGASNTCQIIQVNFPDNTYKQYTYNNNYGYVMSSEIDENHNTVYSWSTINDTSSSHWGYITTSTSEGSAANINKYSFIYNSNNTVVTDSLGNINTLNNTIINGISYTNGSSTICSDCHGFQANTTTYDLTGNLIKSTDFNGNTTTYTYGN